MRQFVITEFILLGLVSVVLGSLQPHGPLHQPSKRQQNFTDSLPPTDSWLGWGGDLNNNHHAATDAKVSSTNLDLINSSCEVPYSDGVSAAPYVQDGTAYFPTWSGELVALQYEQCHIKWMLNVTQVILQNANVTYANITKLVSRTTPAVDPDSKSLFIGTQGGALLIAVNQENGHVLDTVQLDPNPLSQITMSPTFYKGKLLIGVANEETDAVVIAPGYQCCSFIGSFQALELKDGKLSVAWYVPTLPPDQGLSGAAVWGSQPAIDIARNQVIIGTGNTYKISDAYNYCKNETAKIPVIAMGNTTYEPCIPREAYQESVLAIDIDEGFINWSNTFSPLDAWTLACTYPGANRDACPPSPGPDADFGMAPILIPGSEHTPHGKDIVVIGQKNGNLYALSAQAGRLLWATAVAPGGDLGGLIWGMAADETSVYYTGTNSNRVSFRPFGASQNVSNSIFGAHSLLNGSALWQTPAPRNATSYAPPMVVNDLVFTGTTTPYNASQLFGTGPGTVIAIDRSNGKILKEWKLGSYFQSTMAAVGDYVLFGTGYGFAPPVPGGFTVWKVGT